MFFHIPVQVAQFYAGFDFLSQNVKRLGYNPAGFTHPFDFTGTFAGNKHWFLLSMV
jgi:hypothetical protein